MKPLRDWLLEAHGDATPNLDRIRRQVIGSVVRPVEASRRREVAGAGTTLLRAVWLEIVVPCRTWWTAIGFAWLLVVGLQVVSWTGIVGDTGQPTRDHGTVEHWLARQQMMAEWLGSEIAVVGDEIPGPRSDGSATWKGV